MSFMKGQAVTYIDHEGKQQGALVLVPDNANHEATIALVKADATDATLNSADFGNGLDRKFNIDSTQDRIATIAAVRQKDADELDTEQPAVSYDDLRETIYASPYTLPTGSFQPTPKPEEPNTSALEARQKADDEAKAKVAAEVAEKAKAEADAKAKEEEAAKAAAAGSGDDQGQKTE